MLLELNKYHNNKTLSKSDRNIIEQKIIIIENLAKSNMTPAAQTITMQEHVISLISIIRKVTPNYNPNMIVFMPNNPQPSIDSVILAEKLQIYIPNDFGLGTSNIETELIIRRTLPIYLEYKKPDLSVMSPTERDYCLAIIKKYAPEYFATLQ
jgi:hypothetical protein